MSDKMDTFDIKDEKINVEDIMRQIRENIRMRREDGTYKPEAEDQHQIQKKESDSGNSIQKDIQYINSNWDIQYNSYYIHSHRPIMGTILIKGRELINGEVKRYVDPVIWKQREFNGSVTRLLNETMRRSDEFSNRSEEISKRNEEISRRIDENTKIIENIHKEVSGEVEEKVRGIFDAINQDIKNKAWLVDILENRSKKRYDNVSIPTLAQISGLNYFVFEEKFRLSRDVIKHRQSEFVQFFEHCNNVLDIGSGRGEFLELLKAKGIGAHGIDIDDDMVEYCRSIGLNVEKIDAISYLDKIDTKSLDGVFIDQVVEHLEPDYLIKMLKLCYDKIKYGHHIVIETVNPLSLVSFTNFYIDMTHKKPVHPETLKFLLESMGFREIELKFVSPIPDEGRLKKMEKDENMDEKEKKRIDSYNQNIDMLNNRLYGAQDYVVIGKR